jgi:hypothetical protein
VQLLACGGAVAAAFTTAWAIRDDSMLLAGLLTGVPFVLATLPAIGRAALATADADPEGDADACDDRARIARSLAWVTLLFAAVVSVISPSGGGNQWGQRFLLPVVPLLTLLLAWRLHTDAPLRASRPVIAATVAAVLAGAFTQAVGIRNHLTMRRELSAVSAAIGALPARYIVATEWYVPQALTLLEDTHGKRLLLATGEGDIAHAVDALARQGEDSFVLILREDEPSLPRHGDYALGETLRFELVPEKLVAREFRRSVAR